MVKYVFNKFFKIKIICHNVLKLKIFFMFKYVIKIIHL